MSVHATMTGIPLSFPQQQLWLVEQIGHGGAGYNETRALRITGELDAEVLSRAVEVVVGRHEALRTTIGWADDEATQVVHPPAARFVRLLRVDVAGPEREAEATQVVRRLVEAPYDLGTGPLVRWSLVRLDAQDHVFVVCIHHIVCDGVSMTIILDEVQRAYQGLISGAGPDLPPVRAQYRHFALWQRQRDLDGELERELSYWLQTLDGAPTVLQLAPHRLRPPQRAGVGSLERVSLPHDVVRGLPAATASSNGTPFTVLAAGFAALVHRLTGRDDLVLGTGAPGRPLGRFDDAVGFFASVLPVRLRPHTRSQFGEFADSVAEALFDAFDHQHASFPRLVERLGVDRDPSVPPLIQVVFSMWDAGIGDAGPPSLDVRPFLIPRTRSRFELAVEAVRDQDEIELVVEYDTALFDPADVKAMVSDYTAILRQVLAVPSTRLADLPVEGCAAAHVTSTAEDRLVARGAFLIPLGQVEANLRAQVGVRDVAIVTGPDGDLVGYVVTNEMTVEDQQLDAALPQYARPCAWVRLDELPRDDTGQVDRAALARRRPPVRLPPAKVGGRLLDIVVDAWTDALRVSSIDPDDDFFALGGHSILAARVSRTLTATLGREVPVGAVFEHPTVAGLTAWLADAPGSRLADPEWPRESSAADHGDHSPLTAAQLQIWVNEQLATDADDFIATVGFDIRGPLDPNVLAAALDDVAERHPALRASVHVVGDLPELRFRGRGSIPVTLVDVADYGEPRRRALALVREHAALGFDLAEGPLVRAMVCRLDHDRWLLALVQHHLITDGASMRVFTEDLGRCYAARLRSVPAPLADPGTSLAAYARWEQRWLNSDEADRVERYWRERLHGVTPLQLTEGRLPGQRTSRRTVTLVRRLDGSVTSLLLEIARNQQATPFMVVTTAFAIVLHHWSGQNDFVIGTTVDNRPLRALDEVVGCFVNSIAVPIDCSGDPSFTETLGRVRRSVLFGYRYQQLPFNRVVRAVGGWSDPSRMPIFQITSEWVDYNQLSLSLPGCTVHAEPVAMDASRYEISLFSALRPDGLELSLEYAVSLWDPRVVEQRLDALVETLRRVADAPGTPLSALADTVPVATASVQTSPKRRAERFRAHWLLRRPSDDAAALLFCLPYAGGGASMFRRWPRRIGEIEVCPVQLPGRENRLREPPPQTYEQLAAEVAAGLLEHLNRPFAFFGHCGSALIGLEIGRYMREKGWPTPARLFVSSMVTPHRTPEMPIFGAGHDMIAKLVADMAHARGAEVVPELAEMAVQVMRDDVEVCRRYRSPEPALFTTPITVISWQDDDLVAPAETGGWADYGADRSVILPGDHWSFLEAPVPLCDELRRGLRVVPQVS